MNCGGDLGDSPDQPISPDPMPIPYDPGMQPYDPIHPVTGLPYDPVHPVTMLPYDPNDPTTINGPYNPKTPKPQNPIDGPCQIELIEYNSGENMVSRKALIAKRARKKRRFPCILKS